MRFRFLTVVLVVATSCAGSANGPACGGSSEGECIAAGECTLLLVSDRPGDYVCVATRNACEAGFVQRDASAAACEQKAGCRFVPAECYCPPDLTCVCGGGPPAQCVPDASGRG